MADGDAIRGRLARWVLDDDSADDVVGWLIASIEAMVAAIEAVDDLSSLGLSADADAAIDRLEGLVEDALDGLDPAARRARVAQLSKIDLGPSGAGLLTPYAADLPAEAISDRLDVRGMSLPEALAAHDVLADLIGFAAVDAEAAARAGDRWLDPLEAAIERMILSSEVPIGHQAIGPRGAALIAGAVIDSAPEADVAEAATADVPPPNDGSVLPFTERIAPPLDDAPFAGPPRGRARPLLLAVVAMAAVALLAVYAGRQPSSTPSPEPVASEAIGLHSRVPPWVGALLPPPPPTMPETRHRPAMLPVPAGTFMIGSPPDEPERAADEDRQSVTLTRPYWIARTEVTQAQWSAVMGTAPARFEGADGGGPDHPIEQVSWFDAVAFVNTLSETEGLDACYRLVGCTGTPGDGAHSCRAAEFVGLDCTGYRLPTEAEWEHAARAGSTDATSAGPLVLRDTRDAPVLEEIAWYSGNSGVERGGLDCRDWTGRPAPASRCGTHPVGQKAPNAWGLHDTLGNVWEWTHDGHGERAGETAVDPTGVDGAPRRVTKGCGWFRDARFCRLANRYRPKVDYRSSVVGFRPVRTRPR